MKILSRLRPDATMLSEEMFDQFLFIVVSSSVLIDKRCGFKPKTNQVGIDIINTDTVKFISAEGSLADDGIVNIGSGIREVVKIRKRVQDVVTSVLESWQIVFGEVVSQRIDLVLLRMETLPLALRCDAMYGGKLRHENGRYETTSEKLLGKQVIETTHNRYRECECSWCNRQDFR